MTGLNRPIYVNKIRTNGFQRVSILHPKIAEMPHLLPRGLKTKKVDAVQQMAFATGKPKQTHSTRQLSKIRPGTAP